MTDSRSIEGETQAAERPAASPATRTDDPALMSPLAHFEGRVPPAPAWFVEAVGMEPRRSFINAQGADLEVLQWGDPAKPGVLLLHGMTAHADWWDFIAPLLADRYHVVAMSWSGMGRSGWRETYPLSAHVAEALTVMEETGLFTKRDKPFVIGHSFGGRRLVGVMAEAADRLRATVLVDVPVPPPSRAGSRAMRRDDYTHRIYPSEAAALARFRFSPAQPCTNLFIADHIARHSLKRVVRDGGEGWTWRFDPALLHGSLHPMEQKVFKRSACPYAIVTADQSRLYDAEVAAYLKSLLRPGTPWRVIRDAGHHLMVDQPLTFAATLRELLDQWP